MIFSIVFERVSDAATDVLKDTVFTTKTQPCNIRIYMHFDFYHFIFTHIQCRLRVNRKQPFMFIYVLCCRIMLPSSCLDSVVYNEPTEVKWTE